MALRTGLPTPIASRTSATTPDAIEAALETGARKAQAISSGVVADVREAMGVGPVRTPA